MTTRIFSLYIVLFFLLGCSHRDEPPAGIQDYFPLEKGLYFIYSVDESNIVQNVETKSSYELKVAVTDSFPNAEGTTTYVLSRYMRPSVTSPWTPIETWSATVLSGKLVVKKGNEPYVFLSSPLFVNQEWDGNAMNTRGGQEFCGDESKRCDIYTIASLTDTMTAADSTFSDVLTVEENNDPDRFTVYDVRKVKYGKNVGILMEDRQVLTYCNQSDCYAKLFVDTGIKYKRTLKSYGKE